MSRVPVLYLDLCSLKRPWDDQRVERNRDEGEAVIDILRRMEEGKVVVIDSSVLRAENARNPLDDRRRRTDRVLGAMPRHVRVVHRDRSRQLILVRLGFGPLDALHVAVAERIGADVLLTTDDHLLVLGHKHAATLKVDVGHPREWLRRNPR